MRCPNCGARNPEGAAWCSQCLTDLRPTDPDDVVPSATQIDDTTSPPAVVDTLTDVAATDENGDLLQSGGGRFRRRGGQIEWLCEVCQSWNPVGMARCTVCGTSMAGPEVVTAVRPQTSPTVARLLTVLLPGAGHAALGQMATAWARGLTYLLWLIGGTTLVISAISSHESALPGIILLLGAAVLWVITFLDVQTLLAGRVRQILDARVFLWLVVGVIGLLMLTFMTTFSRVGGGGA